MKSFGLLVIPLGFGLLAGCSSSSHSGGVAAPELTTLQDLNDLLRAALGSLGRAPTKLADLDRHQAMFTRGYNAVKSGDVVVLWGATQKGEGQAGKDEEVVAYEKGVPANGGYVLLSAGTVKKMTAAEFSAAPKAGKR